MWVRRQLEIGRNEDMIRYVFREDFVAIKNADRADPQVVGELLAGICDSNGGRLTPEATVAAAKNRRHPLHKHFEWDDAAAAHAYRLDQARELIRVVRVIEDNNPPRYAFLSVRDKDGTAYRAVGEVMRSADLQLKVRQQALRDLRAWERRYSQIADVCELVRLASDRLEETV